MASTTTRLPSGGAVVDIETGTYARFYVDRTETNFWNLEKLTSSGLEILTCKLMPTLGSFSEATQRLSFRQKIRVSARSSQLQFSVRNQTPQTELFFDSSVSLQLQ